MKTNVDVLCVGHACYDLVFAVDHHPGADEKTFAEKFIHCGGGPAANAALTVSRLGLKSAFAGYLGNDFFGRRHLEEFSQAAVNTDLIIRGDSPTPLSAILVKPDGKRTVVNHKGDTPPLPADSFDLSRWHPQVILFDGHEPEVSLALMKAIKGRGILTVLDAGSVHRGSLKLLECVDYTVASQKFARECTGKEDPQQAALKLGEYCSAVVITLGEAGLVWKNEDGSGSLPAFSIDAVDTTGAGDAFHGAFAAGLASGKRWQDLLTYAGAVAA
ncbi:MAG: PfkB family carbohydrate kinase, partial [Desulfobacterales bacterium]|nr:PfkB family carbohydrate kinase [Desulfobacterales bacterium]